MSSNVCMGTTDTVVILGMEHIAVDLHYIFGTDAVPAFKANMTRA